VVYHEVQSVPTVRFDEFKLLSEEGVDHTLLQVVVRIRRFLFLDSAEFTDLLALFLIIHQKPYDLLSLLR
jgi:hypothetical protein